MYSNRTINTIWGSSDTILFIFAGAAAEFAVNKAVDWLYFTGKLPADPLGRLFSTVTYARDIIFSHPDDANKAIDRMRSIHQGVENARGTNIPDWAYRDVLYMLIFYSIRAQELLHKPLSMPEKEEVVEVFLRVGQRMQIPDLPVDYNSWRQSYWKHTREDLQHSKYTDDLFKQYRKHLGLLRYTLLLEVQRQMVSGHVASLLGLGKPRLPTMFTLYKAARFMKADSLLKSLLLPSQYKHRIKALDRQHS